MAHVSSLQGPDARALGLSIIEELTGQDLPISAANYEVWLAYRTGAVADLAAAIREVQASGRLTQNVLDALSEKYFAGTRLSLQMLETGDGIARELAEVLACLRNAGEQTRTYGDSLDAAQTLDP